MCECVSGHGARLACVLSVSALLILGPTGCGGEATPETGTQSKMAPEVAKANENMENYMKTQPKTPKKAH